MDADGVVYDLSPLTADIDEDFLGANGVVAVERALAAEALPRRAITGERIGAPVARPGKVICVGPNYRKPPPFEPPVEPALFLKAPDTVVGAYDQVLIPRGGTAVDWEIELAVVVGATARYLDGPADAKAVIAGYAISHDVSERAFQHERGGTIDKGKCCETFNPLGPWLVTPDELSDPTDLRLRLWVDGEVRQDASTRDMIFDPAQLVWYASQFMVLRPGDILNTGTPPGCAIGLPGRPYLRAGQIVELEVTGLGRQRQVIGTA
ncbi:fumarylacetoacetate hydrolase family protein [Hamadaea sp.]|uniref:fumarylacetoacetate hydrolase family protein n=1 Tax=Hamadaea sp. TaxID=2024425 RepID=UPI0025BCE0FA|nr:fumarylacetoacetate hydrolase family protein [Hamadaea sp.]